MTATTCLCRTTCTTTWWGWGWNKPWPSRLKTKKGQQFL